MPTVTSLPFRISIRTGLFILALMAPAAARETTWNRLTVLDRSITQDQGDWQIDYRLRHDGPSSLTVMPDEVSARIEGWVSNSRAAGHAVPRWSSLAISGPSGLRATTEIIASTDEDQRCAERAVLTVTMGDDLDDPRPVKTRGRNTAGSSDNDSGSRPILSLSPGTIVRVRLRLEHRHVLHGDYDPLLGTRTLELALGSAVLSESLPLDQEHRLALPKPVLLEPADDRRDTNVYVSAPDSLHVAAHVPGGQSYRFPEQPVRYGTRMRLRFWYLIAAGTEGECRARIMQYKDSPNAWKVLSDGRIDLPLIRVGRWVKVEREFRTERDATTFAFDVRIDSSEVGELWIDDVTLTPVETSAEDP